MSNIENAYIYGLSDPLDRKIYYIGHTVNLDGRLAEHMGDKSDTPKTQWVSGLLTAGAQPIMVVLDIVDYQSRYSEEYRWIYLGRERNWPLNNTSAMETER